MLELPALEVEPAAPPEPPDAIAIDPPDPPVSTPPAPVPEAPADVALFSPPDACTVLGSVEGEEEHPIVAKSRTTGRRDRGMAARRGLMASIRLGARKRANRVIASKLSGETHYSVPGNAVASQL